MKLTISCHSHSHIIISSKDEDTIKKVINDLQKNYPITSLGETKFFLGIWNFKKMRWKPLIFPKNKINQLVKDFQLKEANYENCYNLQNEGNLLPSNAKYKQAIGRLSYIFSCTRPGTVASTHILSRRCNNPRKGLECC